MNSQFLLASSCLEQAICFQSHSLSCLVAGSVLKLQPRPLTCFTPDKVGLTNSKPCQEDTKCKSQAAVSAACHTFSLPQKHKQSVCPPCHARGRQLTCQNGHLGWSPNSASMTKTEWSSWLVTKSASMTKPEWSSWLVTKVWQKTSSPS